MQTLNVASQLELSLLEDLKTAKSEPLAYDLNLLWQKLEQVIELTDKNHLLRVLGDAIASIVEVYVLRANAILATLEVQDSQTEPILSEDFLNDLMPMSMSIDLSDMMEQLFQPEKPQPQNQVSARRSIVVPQEQETTDVIAQPASIDPKQMLAELAGSSEQVSVWAGAISVWMQQRHDDEAVSLIQLQQALGMPLVEIWLGLLLSPVHRYDWEQKGDFYLYAKEILLRRKQLPH